MSYKSYKNTDETKSDDGREPGKPHPDASANINFWNRFIKDEKIKKILANTSVVYDGINPTTNESGQKVFEEYVCVSLYWNSLNGRHGWALNFHQSTEKFKEQIGRFFRLEHEMRMTTKWE